MKTFNDGFSLLNALPAAVFTCNHNGGITWYNKEAAKLWTSLPQVGQDQWCVGLNMFSAEGAPLNYKDTPVALALASGKDLPQSEIIIEGIDGSLKQFAINIKLTYDDSGTVSGAVVLLTDSIFRTQDEADKADDSAHRSLSELLERKVEERTQSLKKSEERYHKMIEEVQDYAIVLLDTEGVIINWNRGAEKIKGYTEKEILGRNFREFYLDHDRKNLLPESLIQQAHDTGRAMHEGWRKRKDGTTFWGSIVITALHDNEDNIIGFSKVTRDLTERKLADDRMANYAKDIEFRNKQLEEYAYIASHDLQEPLRKIQVFSELLENDLEENEKEGALRSLAKIKTASKRMSNLIKDVLKYSQLSRADELFETVDLNTIFATVKEDFDLLTEQKGVTIQHTSLPVITGIPIQLHQLFGNLLSNAIKFSAENPLIEITASNLPASELVAYPKLNANHSYVKILFKDNGVGFNQQ